MRIWKRIIYFICFILLTLPYPCVAKPLICQSPYKGQTLTSSLIEPILKAHNVWLTRGRRGTGHANLCGTNLSGINLSDRNLSYSNLSGSDLSGANLQNALLNHADLYKTYFRWATLIQAKLQNANLEDASLENANLRGADLNQANLQKANMSYANLQNADLRGGANLQNADLHGADLEGADLSWANLQGANLSDANLSAANLQHANLTDTNLNNTNLTKANLSYAKLSNSNLTATKLGDTNLTEANMKNAIYQPKFGQLPDLIALTTAKNFHTIRFEDTKSGIAPLAELRAAYKKLGIRSMERLTTAIIKHRDMVDKWRSGGWGYVESAFSYIFFYLTCDYGASPGRPLEIFILITLLLIIPYRIALSIPGKNGGIVVSWTPKKFTQCNEIYAATDQEKKISTRLRPRPRKNLRGKIAEQIRLIRIAFFFSLVSAFSIGWQEVNVGNWLLRLQSREFVLKGKGWVRIIAGAHALIGAYLVVLWIVTYFARPFEW